MRSQNKLKAQMEAIHRQFIGVKKIESVRAVGDIKRLYRKFGFTVWIPKVSLVKGRKTA